MAESRVLLTLCMTNSLVHHCARKYNIQFDACWVAAYGHCGIYISCKFTPVLKGTSSVAYEPCIDEVTMRSLG